MPLSIDLHPATNFHTTIEDGVAGVRTLPVDDVSVAPGVFRLEHEWTAHAIAPRRELDGQIPMDLRCNLPDTITSRFKRAGLHSAAFGAMPFGGDKQLAVFNLAVNGRRKQDRAERE